MIPGYQALGEDSKHDEMHRKLFKFGFAIIDEVTDTAPTTDTLPSGFSQIYSSGGTVRLYFNVQGTIYYIGMTAA